MGGMGTDPEREFAASTTLHGIGRLVESSRAYFKLAWLAILLSCLSVCVWQITCRFQAYYKYEANTQISTKYVKHLEFPAVTICNFNRYRLSAITRNESACLQSIIQVNDYNYKSFPLSSQLDFSDYDSQEGFSEDPGKVDCSRFSFTEFTKRAGFVLDGKTLGSCSWRGRKDSCSAADFTHSFTSFGNCWTFNSGKNGEDILSETLAGSGNGLKMLIDIQQDDYTETTEGNMEAGLKVMIHDQGTPPNVYSAGLAIQPGTHAYMSTRVLKFENLEPPWGDCNASKTLEDQRAYTMEGCVMECRARLVFKHCKCRLVRHPGNAVECTVDQTKNCGLKILAQIQSGEINGCDCPVPCKFTRFATTLSTASVVSQAVSNQIWSSGPSDDNDSLNTPGDKVTWINEPSDFDWIEKYDPEYINENWIVLDVFYSEINYQKYEQSIAITSSGLISDIGGQMGLFLGASFITLAEILAYLGQRFGRSVKNTVAKGKSIRPLLSVDKSKWKEIDLAWVV